MKSFSYDHATQEEAFNFRIAKIRELINTYSECLDIRYVTLEVIKEIGDPPRQRYDFEASKSLFAWIKARIPFRKDICGVETIQIPMYTLYYGGDCDCMVVYAGSSLMSVGVAVKLAVSKQTGNDFDHIFLYIPGANSFFDPTAPVFPMPPQAYRGLKIL